MLPQLLLPYDDGNDIFIIKFSRLVRKNCDHHLIYSFPDELLRPVIASGCLIYSYAERRIVSANDAKRRPFQSMVFVREELR